MHRKFEGDTATVANTVFDALGQRHVRRGELQWRDDKILLADREQYVVTGVPDGVLGLAHRVRVARVERDLPSCVGDATVRLVGELDAGR